MPQGDRTVWTNDAARATWEPRLRRIVSAWGQVERASVAEGARAACLHSALPEGLAALSEWAGIQGLVALPLGPERRPGTDSVLAHELQAGKRWNDRIVITRPELSASWLEAWKVGDDQALAEWLGLPACCRAFWLHASRFGDGLDPVWTMADGAVSLSATARRVDAPAVECNVLLRWLGVRLVPHLPCSFTCDASVRLGRGLAELAVRYGLADEMAWAREMLSSPMEWTAASGVAEIKTSILHLAAPMPMRPVRYTVRLRAARSGRAGGARSHARELC